MSDKIGLGAAALNVPTMISMECHWQRNELGGGWATARLMHEDASNISLDRRPRIEFLIVPRVFDAAPLSYGVIRRAEQAW